MAAREEAVPGAQGTTTTETDRMEAFSDGVFAIVITLLVLELRPPAYESDGLLDALLHEKAAYLAFVISFVYVGVIWLNHHALLRLVGRTNLALNWINLALLFGAVIIPFPTAVLASAFTQAGAADRRVAVVLYALSAALMSVPWLAFFAYLERHPALLAPDISTEHLHAQRARPITGMILYGGSAALGWFVNPIVGLIGIIAMIIYHAVTSQGLNRRSRRRLLSRRRT